MIEYPQKPRVLVLGANGKLGQILWRRLASAAALNLVAVSRRRGVSGGLCWPDDFAGGEIRADAVLALWGVVPGAGDLADNTALAIEAMDMAVRVGATRVLHCSSAAVYRPAAMPLTEDDLAMPGGDYGRAKRAMEAAIVAWQEAREGGPQSCIMRIANVVGADSLFGAIDAGGTIVLDRFGDGQGPQRSYIGGCDLVRCFAALLTCRAHDLPKVVNIAGRAPVAMEDLARAAGCVVTWRDAPAEAVPMVALQTDVLRRLIDLGPASADAAALVADWQRNDRTW